MDFTQMASFNFALTMQAYVPRNAFQTIHTCCVTAVFYRAAKRWQNSGVKHHKSLVAFL